MHVLVLSKKGKGDSVIVERRTGEGELVATACKNFRSENQIQQGSRQLGIPVELLRRAVDGFRQQGTEKVGLPEEKAGSFQVRLRGIFQTAAEGLVITGTDALDALRKAIEVTDYPAEQPVITWEGLDQLAVVDVDYHDQTKLTEPDIDRIIARIVPRPVGFWRTHGGGIRLVYRAMGDFAAGDLCGCAAISTRLLSSTATVEIKHDTRHPGYPRGMQRCGPVHWQAGDCDLSAVRSWFQGRKATEEEIQQWLAEHDLEIGKRYEHEKCPIDPDGKGGRRPVDVRDDGVLCYLCSGRGTVGGRGHSGWLSYDAAVCGSLPTPLQQCVDHVTHWPHARYVVRQHTGLDGELARHAYQCALRVRHGPEDPRIPGAFFPDRSFVRLRGQWSTLRRETLTGDLRAVLEQLPACQYVTADGLRIDRGRVAMFGQPIDLGEYGYPALTVTYGLKIFRHFLEPTGVPEIPVVMHTATLSDPRYEPFRPKYVGPGKRLPLEEAWQQIEEVFPGLTRNYVRLLIAAKGIAEGELGMPPMIFVSGPTGAAKTRTIELAAAMCGDCCHGVTWNPNRDKLRSNIREGKEKGSFVAFNEVIKEGKAAGSSTISTMDYVLNLTPDSISHKLWTGGVPLGWLPVLVWTDSDCPEDLKSAAQLARRLVYVHLPRVVDWEGVAVRYGLSNLNDLRVAIPTLCGAMDAVVSSVIDDFFRFPMHFKQIAAELGYYSLSGSPEAVAARDRLKDFHAAVCQAPDAPEADLQRWKSRGWKVIQRGQETPLAQLWEELRDEDDFCRSRRCAEADWVAMLGSPVTVEFETRNHGKSRLGVRFVHKKSKTELLVNNELHSQVELEPGPEECGAVRLGDAIGGELEFGWAESLPF